MKKFIAGLLTSLVFASFLVVMAPSVSYAQGPPVAQPGDCRSSSSNFLAFPTWYKYLDQDTKVAGKCTLKFNFPGDIAKVGLAVVEILLRLGALAAVGFVIYGGFQFILSQGDLGAGNVPKTTIARHTVQNALIGLVLAMLATGIVRLVGNTVLN
ncbi:MAG: hypothetical protein KIH63_005210 [Candidatus Saccharibacteria bacterium]|nr:hypothetical protein [Candidatus Saccharibacteria bacterium]